MTTPYVGTESGLDVDDAVSIPEPVDADAGNAATFAGAFEALANRIKLLQVKGGFLAKARTWTALQTFNAALKVAAAAATSPQIYSVVGPPGALDRVQLSEWPIHSGLAQKARMYCAEESSGGRFEITLNARWNGTAWVPDSTQPSALYIFDGVAQERYEKVGATAATPFSTWDPRYTVPTYNTTHNFRTSPLCTNAGYRLTADNRVICCGIVNKSGTTSGADSGRAFTFPVGMRPLENRIVMLPYGNTTATDPDVGMVECTVRSDGKFCIATGSGSDASLSGTYGTVWIDGLSFNGEQ